MDLLPFQVRARQVYMCRRGPGLFTRDMELLLVHLLSSVVTSNVFERTRRRPNICQIWRGATGRCSLAHQMCCTKWHTLCRPRWVRLVSMAEFRSSVTGPPFLLSSNMTSQTMEIHMHIAFTKRGVITRETWWLIQYWPKVWEQTTFL